MGMQRQNAETLNLDKLKSQLDQRIKLGESYKAQIAKLENDKEAFIKASSGNVANAESKMELDNLRLISGLTDVSGEGVIITLNDAAETEITDPDTVMDYIIHDSDILNVVNQLRIGGAQAISINNERIIATSEQVCAGPTIKVNSNRYAVPYEIKAIGDPDEITAVIKDSGILDEMIRLGKRVSLKQQNDIVIPKFSNDIHGLISKLEVINSESKKGK
jgi:uncharacterized protein YlxW (UPF0749 family)